MNIVDNINYLSEITKILATPWPDNKTVNIVCHGHSVPSGYFATPFVDTFNAYPHLLHKIIKERFPFSVVNVIVTAIGGENSQSGSNRFSSQVLNHNPDLITIDYCLNDRSIGLKASKDAHKSMIEKSLAQNIKVILLTPSLEQSFFNKTADYEALKEYCLQIKLLATQYKIGLVDSFTLFNDYIKKDDDLTDLLSHVNHPNRKGHEIIANALGKFFLAR